MKKCDCKILFISFEDNEGDGTDEVEMIGKNPRLTVESWVSQNATGYELEGYTDFFPVFTWCDCGRKQYKITGEQTISYTADEVYSDL